MRMKPLSLAMACCAVVSCLVTGCAAVEGAGPSDGGSLPRDSVTGEDVGLPDSVPDGAEGRYVGDAIACDASDQCRPATCQKGICCEGEIVAGGCRCGDGAGCDSAHVCCIPPGAPLDSQPRCLASSHLCRGF